MSDEDWDGDQTRTLTVYLNGRAIPDRDDLGVRVEDDSFLLLVNARHEGQTVTLPDETYGSAWRVVVDTAHPDGRGSTDALKPGATVDLLPHGLLVLQSHQD
ncbi:hypothetical protein [Pseudonocardia sp. WMMC193]|uniref:hypothetical protein n=1 Tax=Pseudonocardia sp. WMMC193 TaxID=2911965 RepID=UPI001F3FF273|nr:hypothetical protein [Pseudonocardia sp. WMMC193]MCF7550695.1 hypothetical protein [Pseudonocardia sp. WMMC193]